MNPSFNLEEPDLFTAGAIGPKGQRVFFLQAREAGHVVSLKLEKQQVGALADYLERMLADRQQPPGEGPVHDVALVEPVEGDWVVGGLGVAFDEELDRIVLIAEELVLTDGDEEGDEDILSEEPPAVARFHLSYGQVIAFIAQARAVVAAGRPPCRYCGRPFDEASGFCACAN
jgi:uncharacterized repeat protein (TIGR03847 family)